MHEVNAMDHVNYESGAYYVMDRGYLDFKRLFVLDSHGSYFVTRAKSNTKLIRMYSNSPDKNSGVKCDQVVKLASY